MLSGAGNIFYRFGGKFVESLVAEEESSVAIPDSKNAIHAIYSVLVRAVLRKSCDVDLERQAVDTELVLGIDDVLGELTRPMPTRYVIPVLEARLLPLFPRSRLDLMHLGCVAESILLFYRLEGSRRVHRAIHRVLYIRGARRHRDLALTIHDILVVCHDAFGVALKKIVSKTIQEPLDLAGRREHRSVVAIPPALAIPAPLVCKALDDYTSLIDTDKRLSHCIAVRQEDLVGRHKKFPPSIILK